MVFVAYVRSVHENVTRVKRVIHDTDKSIMALFKFYLLRTNGRECMLSYRRVLRMEKEKIGTITELHWKSENFPITALIVPPVPKSYIALNPFSAFVPCTSILLCLRSRLAATESVFILLIIIVVSRMLCEIHKTRPMPG